jgi:hypothetical protein
MSREVIAAVTVPAGAMPQARQRLVGSPRAWLPSSPRRAGRAWRVDVRLGQWQHPVRATVGAVWSGGGDTWRSLRWVPLQESNPGARNRRLPDFTGRIGLRHQGDSDGVLLLLGTYDPPGGWVGGALDALVLHKAAQRTVNDLLDDVRERLTAGMDLTALDASPPVAVAGGPRP